MEPGNRRQVTDNIVQASSAPYLDRFGEPQKTLTKTGTDWKKNRKENIMIVCFVSEVTEICLINVEIVVGTLLCGVCTCNGHVSSFVWTQCR